MKKLLLLGFGVLMANVINAQVIFSGVSPAEIQGNYALEYATGWGADLEVPANAVEETLVLYETDTLGCDPATNDADLLGKIAVLYRGDCEFGSKGLSAQNAGAIACVIINNQPGGPVGMAAGTQGPDVTIPVVMISDVDGEALVTEMQNGPVTVFIGNKAGYYADDLGLTKAQILRPRYSSVPSMIATNGTEYDLNLGGTVYNYGSNDQTAVTLQAIITYNGTEIYNQISTPEDMFSGDSLVVTLPDFAPATWDEGYYKLVYKTTADAFTDEYDFDNEIESDFVISATDLSYAKIIDTTMLPNSSGGIRPVDGSGNAIPEYSSCIHFKDPNASRLAASAITFSAIKGSNAADTSLAGEEILLQIYTYDDVFTDMNDAGFSNPIQSFSDLVIQNYSFPSDLAGGEVITVDFDLENIVALEDDQRYMFCVTTFNEELYFGSDPDRDYTANRDFYMQPLFPIEAGAGNFNPNGFGPESVPGISVSFISSAQVSLKEEQLAINMNAYPSPASDVLNIDFKQNEVNKVELVNMMGQTVVAQDVASNANTTALDVAGVENGVYIVKVYLTNNMTHTMQVVVNH